MVDPVEIHRPVQSKDVEKWKRTVKIKSISIFIVVFFVIWVMRVILFNVFDKNLSTEIFKALSSHAFKFVIWVLPVFLYLTFIDKTNTFRYLKLSTSLKEGFYWSLGVLLLGAIGQLVALKLGLDKIGLISVFSIVNLTIGSLFEEILMRGFILSKLSEVTSFNKALLITSLLFYAIHLPGWILIYHNSLNQIFIYSGSIFFIVSLGGGLLVKKSNSLYPSIVLHIVNNFISSI